MLVWGVRPSLLTWSVAPASSRQSRMYPCAAPAGGLASWLCAATFHIPPLPSIPVSSGLFSVSVEIDRLRCGSLHVGHLRSSSLVGGATPSLTVGVDGASLNCSTSQVKINIERKGHAPFLTPHAQVSVEIRDASADVVLQLPTAARGHGLPLGANLTIANLTIGQLTPQIALPSPWGFLDGAIDAAVEGAMRSAVANELPSLLDELIPSLADPLLHNLSTWLAANFPPSATPEPPPPHGAPGAMTHLVDWSDSNNPLRALSFVVDALVGTDGPAGLNGLVRLLTDGTGSLRISNDTLHRMLPPLPTLSLHAANLSLANLTFSVRGMRLSGLDSIDILSLLPLRAAGSHHSLAMGVGWSSLHVGVTLGIEAAPLPDGLVSGAGALDEEFDVDLRLDGLSAQLTTLLAINQTYLDSLLGLDGRLPSSSSSSSLASSAALMPSPRCVALRALMVEGSDEHTIRARLNGSLGVRAAALNVSSASARLEALSPFELEKQLDTALNSAAHVVLSGFPRALSPIIDTLAGGPIRDLLDEALVDLVADSLAGPPCPPPAPSPPSPPPSPPPPVGPPGDIIDWRTSAVRGAADWLIDLAGADGVDAAIDALLNVSGLGGQGTLAFNMSSVLSPFHLQLPPPLGNWSLAFEMLSLSGLDSFTLFDPLGVPRHGSAAAADPAALTAAIDAAQLGLSLGVSLSRDGGIDDDERIDGPIPWPVRPVTLTLRAGLTNASVRVGGRLAINGTRLMRTPLNVFAHPVCLLQPLTDAAMHHLEWSADALHVSAAGNDWGSQSPPGSEAVLAPPFVRLALPARAASTLAASLTFAARLALGVAHTAQCLPPPPSPPTYYDLSASPLLQRLTSAVNATSDAQLDASIDRFASVVGRLFNLLANSSESWPVGVLPLPPLLFEAHDDKVGDIRIELANFSVANADSLYGLELSTHTDEPHRLSAAIGLGNGTARPWTLRTSLHMQLDGIWHALQLEVALSGLRLALGVDIAIDTSWMERLTFGDLLHPTDMCLLRPLDSLLIATNDSGMSLDGAIDARLWPLGAMLGPNVSSHVRMAALPSKVPLITRNILRLVDDRYLSPLLSGPHRKCDVARHAIPPIPAPPPPPSPSPPSHADEYVPLMYAILLVGLPALLLGGAHFAWRARLARRGVRLPDDVDEPLMYPLSTEAHTVYPLAAAAVGERRDAQGTSHALGVAPSALDPSVQGAPRAAEPAPVASESAAGVPFKGASARQLSLARHSSLAGRVAFTAALFGNAIFFFYANVNVGATEHVKLSVSGQRVPVPSVFDFALVSSVEQMWQARRSTLTLFCPAIAALQRAHLVQSSCPHASHACLPHPPHRQRHTPSQSSWHSCRASGRTSSSLSSAACFGRHPHTSQSTAAACCCECSMRRASGASSTRRC